MSEIIQVDESGRTSRKDKVLARKLQEAGYAINSLIQGGGAPVILESYTKAGLPAAGKAGRIARVTDGVRGFWHDDGTVWRKIVPHILMSSFGASPAATAAVNTTAIQAAIDAANSSGDYKSVLVDVAGTYNHNGLSLAPGVSLGGLSRHSTILNNVGTGVNLLIPALANRVTIANLQLTGAASSTHGLHVLDALWFVLRDVSILAWGDNSAGIRLDTVNNPGGNGTYFTELYNPDVNGQARPGVIGIHVTGTAAGANRVRLYGGSIRNNTTGIKITKGDSFTAFQPELSGNTTGVNFDGASATSAAFFRPSFESNTAHVNIAAGAADNSFFHPTFGTPITFGTNNGTRTLLVLTDTSGTGINSKIPGNVDFSGILALSNEVILSATALLEFASRTPAQIAADQNDYSPGLGGFWRLSSDASRTLTGIAQSGDGGVLIIANVGSFDIVLSNQNATSLAASRIITGTGADVTLAPDDTATLVYDTTSLRWRIINTH